jgi:hypothetical protein
LIHGNELKKEKRSQAPEARHVCGLNFYQEGQAPEGRHVFFVAKKTIKIPRLWRWPSCF